MDPKSFYRRMDALLAHIGDAAHDAELLPSVLGALEASLGQMLHFHNGRLYEEHDGVFLLRASNNGGSFTRELALDDPAVELVLRHGSYLFDTSAPGKLVPEGRAAVPVAFVVTAGPSRSGKRWLFVYDLLPAWTHEEIQLCMNAVRAALNFKLASGAMQSDLEKAAQIQQSLLPLSAPEMEGYAFAGRSQPAERVGGDLYDFIRLSDEMVGVSIGDASGHGLPAALLVRDVVTGLRMGLEDQRKIVYTIKKLNQVIHRSTFSTRFISLFYGEVERNGNLLYVNCGHPPPLLVHGDQVRQLEATGTVIGPLRDPTIYRAYAYLEPGATLVLYSDGIIERRNRRHEMYEIRGLRSFVLQHQHLSAQELVDAIFEEVFAYGHHGAWADDATVVVVKRREATG
ncbi:MAG: hypothetical protein KatS3mg043_0557 [Rhodothermaceae bacterium]|nr:MAG: hypothetical protein KatS3mg043_0557 [Rhodothermaceae bacterium]